MRMIYSLRREEKFMYAELIGNLNAGRRTYFTYIVPRRSTIRNHDVTQKGVPRVARSTVSSRICLP